MRRNGCLYARRVGQEPLVFLVDALQDNKTFLIIAVSLLSKRIKKMSPILHLFLFYALLSKLEMKESNSPA